MEFSLGYRTRGACLLVLLAGAAAGLPRVARQAIEGFPDGLPDLTPRGVQLALQSMLDGTADSMGPIPGEAGTDYPVYATVPDTSFDCAAQEAAGIYTDTEADCQAFHMCSPGGDSAAFLCPNGTIFSQQYFVCDWWYNLDCDQQPDFYNLNQLLYQEQEKPNCKSLFCKDD